MELSFAFDMLLRDDAKQLWQEFSSFKEAVSNEEIEKWFLETFSHAKTVYDKVQDLATMQQRPDEKYRSFELRVKKLVSEVFDKKNTLEEITRLFILQGLNSKKLKESFTLDPAMSDDRRRELAVNFEKLTPTKPINAIKKTYAQSVFQSDPRKTFQKETSFKKPSPIVQERDFGVKEYHRPSVNRTESPNNERPMRSMKAIASKFYNDCRGKPTPRGDYLKPGACFCCGELGHRKFECPLRNKCLICGKEGHSFRECHLARKPSYNSPRRILCIHDEEDEADIQTESEASDCVSSLSMEDKKNWNQPPVPISSVGLSQ